MVVTEVDALFKPTSASVRQLLSDLVGGFSIPSYQRPYRWKPADQRRLCDDLISGVDRLVRDESAVAFVGAIITVSGVSDRNVTIPSDARQIIDGQQRLSTILMIAVAAHERLGALEPKVIEKSPVDEETRGWLAEQLSEVRYQLRECLGDTRSFGDDEYKILPKIVRDIADIWSTRQQTARYLSPVANLLHSYINHNPASKFVVEVPTTHIEPEASGSSLEDFEVFHRRFQQVRDIARDVANGSDGDLTESIDLEMVLGPQSLVLAGLFPNVSDSLAPILRAAAGSYAELGQCLRLMLFCRFMLDRMVLTQINAKDETYAFDLFDSLNSTGEPLTAFETFVPLVVQFEGIEPYPTTPSYESITLTSKLLASENDVQSQTARLITSFLLADAGLKVPNKHNSQRRELTQRYRDAENQDQRRAMTKQLANSALCNVHLWQNGELSRGYTGPVASVGPETRFALRFLNQLNHSIVQAPVARYYAEWIADQSAASVASIERVILAATAFSALWRAAHGGTDGIDSVYRGLMVNGVEGICPPLSRTKPNNHDINALPTVEEFVAALRSLLSTAKSNAFSNEEEWIALAATRPIYDEQVELSKFLLLVAGHHAIADGQTGLTKDGQITDSTDLLKGERYTADDRLATIEHVAPQSGVDTGWPSDLFASPAIVHSIGNLTLLPLDDNSLLSNRPWSEKRVLYRALSAKAPDEAKAILDEAVGAGLSLSSEKVDYMVERRQHLPILEASAQYSGEWNAQFVLERSNHLLSRAWKVLDRWLGA